MNSLKGLEGKKTGECGVAEAHLMGKRAHRDSDDINMW